MPLKHLQHMQHPLIYFCNIKMKQLQRTSKTSETLKHTFATYVSSYRGVFNRRGRWSPGRRWPSPDGTVVVLAARRGRDSWPRIGRVAVDGRDGWPCGGRVGHTEAEWRASRRRSGRPRGCRVGRVEAVWMVGRRRSDGHAEAEWARGGAVRHRMGASARDGGVSGQGHAVAAWGSRVHAARTGMAVAANRVDRGGIFLVARGGMSSRVDDATSVCGRTP
jgi:hypothetical protein